MFLDKDRGDGMLDDMLEDRVALIKTDGTVTREEIPSLVMRGKIQIHDFTLPIEVGDHLLRKLPNGLVEDYIVEDPVLNSGLGVKYFTVHVSRSKSEPAPRQATIQKITNHFHGANSRSNMNTTDNSTNISGEVGIGSLRSFLEQVKLTIGSLPKEQQAAIAIPIALLEDEIKNGTPTPSKVAAALQSLKSIAEGATGNLVAAGIVGLIKGLQ